jgi:protein gp37
MNESIIAEWTEKPWNPITGCSKVSSGCANCYAETQANWLHRKNNPRYSNGFELTLHEDLIETPLHWRSPRRIFTCSMSDLFHPAIPKDFLLKVFDTMNRCSQHTFLVLTKRSKRLAELSPEIEWAANIWMGVTVEEVRRREVDNTKTFNPDDPLGWNQLAKNLYEYNLKNLKKDKPSNPEEESTDK